MIVSNEGFALWSRSSEPAFKTRRFIRTKHVTFELPSRAVAVTREYSDEAKSGIVQPPGTWGFPEPAIEMCVRSDRYDQEITILHFDDAGRAFEEEEPVEDTYDRFVGSRRSA
jgi:hypothetical protein